EDATGLEQGRSGREVETPGPDVLSLGRRLARDDMPVSGVRILLDEDRVGPGRDRRSGEDADGLAGPDGAVEAMSGGGDARHAEPGADRGLGGTHGVSVHGGGGEGGLVALRGERYGKGSSCRLAEIDGLGGERHDPGEDAGDRLVDG